MLSLALQGGLPPSVGAADKPLNAAQQRYEAERLSAGVSLDAETWRQLTTCASQLGVGEEELAGLKQACIAGAGARAGAASKL